MHAGCFELLTGAEVPYVPFFYPFGCIPPPPFPIHVVLFYRYITAFSGET
jgi:hypothetical protein